MWKKKISYHQQKSTYFIIIINLSIISISSSQKKILIFKKNYDVMILFLEWGYIYTTPYYRNKIAAASRLLIFKLI